MRLEEEEKSGNPWRVYPNISSVAVRGQGGKVYIIDGCIEILLMDKILHHLGCIKPCK